jgi:hypothetical protein
VDFLQRHCRLLVMILGAAKVSDLNCLRFVSDGSSFQGARSKPWKHPNEGHADEGNVINVG